MRLAFRRIKCLFAAGLLVYAWEAAAQEGFIHFTPMVGDGDAGTLPESAPYKLASSNCNQVTLVARDVTQASRFDSGSYDMLTANETGFDAGRYLFSPFETNQPGIQRIDLATMTTVTLWASPAPYRYMAFDASRWTPWGSLLTAEESWRSQSGASKYGRLFEVNHPLAEPTDIRLTHRTILPRVAHEGLAFDNQRNLYFIDEHTEGHIFRYTSTHPQATHGDDFFATGQTFVLRVGNGKVEEAVGAATWIPLTHVNGEVRQGGIVVTDANGLKAIDGRATSNLPAFRGTRFDRPEDLEIKTLKNGRQFLFVATTTNHKVFSIDLSTDRVSLFATRHTKDMATGLPVGRAFKNPDNLAIDARGNVYIVEDQPGGVADIWFAQDENHDGVAEAIGKWARLSTLGAESSGLYFDKFKSGIAYINVQHPDSGVDRTLMIRCTNP